MLPYHNLVIVHRVNTDEVYQEVEMSQIGTLLWMILAAAETELGEEPFIESAAGMRLTEVNLYETGAWSTLRTRQAPYRASNRSLQVGCFWHLWMETS